MSNAFKTIAAATAIGAIFATNAALADEAPAEFEYLPHSTVFASVDCIEGALRDTFGKESQIISEMEHGLISAQNWIDGEPVLADVYLGFQDAVASLNVTIIDGVAPMAMQNGELVATAPAPQGTASLFYDGDHGTPEFTLQGYAREPLEKYIDALDRKIKSCATPGAMALAIS